MTITGRVARMPGIRHVRRELRHLEHYLVKDEWGSSVRLSAPGLVARGFNSSRAYLYPDRPDRRSGYVSDLTYIRRVGALNPPEVKQDLKDKVHFAGVLERNGLGHAVPQTYGTLVDGTFRSATDVVDGPVVVKPAGGSRGRSVFVAADLASALSQAPADGSYVLQEPLVQDHFRRTLYPGSLNTLRIQVIREQAGAVPHVATVVQRIGRDSTAPVDNFSRGALAARVGRTDAVLSYAVTRVTAKQRVTFDRHPDTGAQITGTVATGIEAARKLALAAMEVWPTALNVGWDVAVCERGPVLVEGNGSWPNFGFLQAHGPITDDPVVRAWCERYKLL